MLILTRKLGESVNIGASIKITIKAIKGRQVRLGIEAPEEISIHREEAYLKSQQENHQAETFAMTDLVQMKRALTVHKLEEKQSKRLSNNNSWSHCVSPINQK